MSELRDEGLEQYFESMKNLWDSKDFQVLLSELVVQAESIGSIELTEPSATRTLGEEVSFRKGQMNVIRTLQNLSANIELLEEDYLKSLEPQDDTDDEQSFNL